jgi:hypothetical protein
MAFLAIPDAREIAEFHLPLSAADGGPPRRSVLYHCSRYNRHWYRLFHLAAPAAKSAARTLLKVVNRQFNRDHVAFATTMIMGAECGNFWVSFFRGQARFWLWDRCVAA